MYKGEIVMTDKNASLNIRLEESLMHDYKKMCEERGQVMSKVIRGLLIQDLEQYLAYADKKKGLKNGRKN